MKRVPILAADTRPRNEELGVLWALTKALAQRHSTDVLVEAVMDALGAGLGAERLAVVLLESPGLPGRLAASRGLSEESGRLLAAYLPWPLAIENLKPLLVSDTAQDEGLNSIQSALLQDGVCALALFPLQAEGSLRGYVAVGYDAPREFSGQETGLAETVAGIAALALHAGAATPTDAYTMRLQRQLEEEARRIDFLSKAGQLLASSLDYETTLGNVARLAVPHYADWCVIHLLREDGGLHQVTVAHVDPAKVEFARRVQERYPPDPTARQGVYKVVRTGAPELYSEISDAALAAAARDEEHLEVLREAELRSAMIVPVLARGRALGTITFVASQPGRYTAADLPLAQELGRHAGLAIDNARLYERQRRVAQTLQQAFLPAELPQLPGISVSGTHRVRAPESDVGGDWYDAFLLADGRMALSVGDVTGRGLQAAVTMGQARQGIRAAALEHISPSSVLDRVSRLLQVTRANEMATALFGILDPVAQTFTYAVAGHPSPILLPPEGNPVTLPGRGLPLGTRPLQPPTLHTVTVPRGSMLVLYTDGLTEYNRDPVEGERILLEALHHAAGTPDPAQAIAQGVLGSSAPADDVAILTVTLAPLPTERFTIALPAIPSALPLARQTLRQVAEGFNISPTRLRSLEVAVGEALNNAVEHAYGAASGEVDLRVQREGGSLRVEVEDAGQWRPPRPGPGGRGLELMRTLVDLVEIKGTPTGTLVRLTLDLEKTAPEAGL